MIIRCPQCEYTRTISPAAIPPAAERAVCPKCGHRFRFRALPPDVEAPAQDPHPRVAPSAGKGSREPGSPPRIAPSAGKGSRGAAPREAPADRRREEPPATAGTAERDPLPALVFQSDTPVEERVERDLLLLRHDGDRPSRDLGRLDPERPDLPDLEMPAAAPDPLPAEEDNGEIPWENPAAHGWVRAFLRTLYGVMFNPPAFFSRLRPARSLAAEYLFFILLGYIAILSSVAWTQAALHFLPNLQTDLQPRLPLPLLFLVAPVVLGLMLLFAAGGIQLLLRLFAEEPADFSLTFKVVSYAISPFILCIVPFVGPVAGALWFLFVLFSGCRHGLGISGRLAAGVSLPPALMLIAGIIWFLR